MGMGDVVCPSVMGCAGRCDMEATALKYELTEMCGWLVMCTVYL